MTQFLIYTLTSLALFCVGMYHLLLRPHLLRKLLALNVMSSGVFLFLVAVARRNQDSFPDPVPHAMVLTGIVIALSITAFGVGVVRRMDADVAEERPAAEELD